MTAADPSCAKRIDSSTRALAEESARLAGVTLRDWLNEVVIQDAAFRQAESRQLEQLAAAERLAEPVSLRAGLPDDGIEPFLASLVAQLDAVRDEMASKIEEGAVQRSLRQTSSSVEVSDAALEPLPATVEDTSDTAPAPLDPAAAVKQLGVEVARVVEIVDARLARMEVAIADLINRFPGRIDAFEPGYPAAAADDMPVASVELAADEFDPAIPDDDWAEDLGVSPVATDERVAVAETSPQLAPVADEATDPIAQPDGDPSALASSPILPRSRPRTERPSPRRASRVRTTLMVVGGGAGLGLGVAACLLVLSGSIGGSPARSVVAAHAPAARPSHLSARSAPVEFMTVAASAKPAP